MYVGGQTEAERATISMLVQVVRSDGQCDVTLFPYHKLESISTRTYISKVCRFCTRSAGVLLFVRFYIL